MRVARCRAKACSIEPGGRKPQEPSSHGSIGHAMPQGVRPWIDSDGGFRPPGWTRRACRRRDEPDYFGFFGGVNLIFFTSSTTVPSGCTMPETAVMAFITLSYLSA